MKIALIFKTALAISLISTLLFAQVSFGEDVTATSPTGFVRKGWNLISLPYTPKDGNPPTVLTGINMSNASLQLWDNASQTGDGCLVTDANWQGPVKIEAAYRIIVSSIKNLSYTNIRNNTSDRITSKIATTLIPDPGLEKAIRKKLNKLTGDITIADLQGITGKLDANYRSIINLTGMEYCTNLTELDLHNNQIKDITPLAEFSNLETLYLEYNHISDITPLINNTGLGFSDYVYLTGNPLNAKALQDVEILGPRDVAVSPCRFADL